MEAAHSCLSIKVDVDNTNTYYILIPLLPLAFVFHYGTVVAVPIEFRYGTVVGGPC